MSKRVLRFRNTLLLCQKPLWYNKLFDEDTLMSRYRLGQTILTAGFVFKDEQYFGVLRRPYRCSWLIGLDTTPVLKTELIRLTVVEHHKVPGEWSDALEYDGYVLRDDNGALWYNQYPYASYGQLDDSYDRVFRRAELHRVGNHDPIFSSDTVVLTERIEMLYEAMLDGVKIYENDLAKIRRDNDEIYEKVHAAYHGLKKCVRDIERGADAAGINLLREELVFRDTKTLQLTRSKIFRITAKGAN